MSEWTHRNTVLYPTISTRVSPETMKRIEKRCEQIGEPRSLVVKALIESALDVLDMTDAIAKARRKNKTTKGKH
jgi:predicted DNA-binding protein